MNEKELTEQIANAMYDAGVANILMPGCRVLANIAILITRNKAGYRSPSEVRSVVEDAVKAVKEKLLETKPLLLTSEQLDIINERIEKDFEDTEMTDGEWEAVRDQLLCEAQRDADVAYWKEILSTSSGQVLK